MRLNSLIRLVLAALALVVTALVGRHQYKVRREHARAVFRQNFWQGPLNTQVVYEARVMPYVIDTEGSCSVPRWLDRGVHISREPCEEGISLVKYGDVAEEVGSWRNLFSGGKKAAGQGRENTVGQSGTQAKWKTSLVPENTDPFMHALLQCQKGSHMACLIMDMSKGPFHNVSDPLTCLTAETMAPSTNEDTVHLCGKSYKDCVVVPASSPECLLNRDFSPSFNDEQFEDLVKQSNYFFRMLEW